MRKPYCHPDLPYYAKGMCRNCYEKDLRKRNPNFVERQRENTEQWVRNHKRWKADDDRTYQSKPDSKDRKRYQKLKSGDENFLVDIAEKRRGERASNPQPHRDSTKKWKLGHPQQIRDMNRDWCYRKKYGITLEQYNKLLAAQNGICVLCGKKDAYKNKGRNLFVDHNHQTNVVRGLLCSRCNTMIGHIELVGIDKIIEYLSK